MPMRICEQCQSYFIAGTKPDQDVNVEQCSRCRGELRIASLADLHAHLCRRRERHQGDREQ